VDAVSRAAIGPRLDEHPDRVERARVHSMMKRRPMRVKSGRVVSIHVHAGNRPLRTGFSATNQRR
jgi:hypothetical protein